MPPKSWNPWKAFDLSEKERQLIDQRRQLRQQWAADFTRKASSPYRPNYRLVFDPAVQRAISARATMQDFFQPNRRAAMILGGALLLPLAYAWCFMKFNREPFLKAMSNGEIPYKNRDYKDLY